MIFQSLLACSAGEKKAIREIFHLSRKGDFGLNRNRRSSPGLPDLGFSHIAGCLLVRHSKTLPVSAWELPTGGRPQAKPWICLAVMQPWAIAFPTMQPCTSQPRGCMYLIQPLNTTHPNQDHLSSAHNQNMQKALGFLVSQERKGWIQAKGTELAQRCNCGEGLEEAILWCLGEMPLAMAMASHSPSSGVGGATHTLHRPKEELDPAVRHSQLPMATGIEWPRLRPACPRSSILARS